MSSNFSDVYWFAGSRGKQITLLLKTQLKNWAKNTSLLKTRLPRQLCWQQCWAVQFELCNCQVLCHHIRVLVCRLIKTLGKQITLLLKTRQNIVKKYPSQDTAKYYKKVPFFSRHSKTLWTNIFLLKTWLPRQQCWAVQLELCECQTFPFNQKRLKQVKDLTMRILPKISFVFSNIRFPIGYIFWPI